MLNISLMFVSIIVLLKHYFTLKSKKTYYTDNSLFIVEMSFAFLCRIFHYRNYRSEFHSTSTLSCQSLHSWYTQSSDVDEGFSQRLDH